ncbi:hypothetical protein QOT17_023115 [Balamuthia mandrillaris]
MHRIRLGSATKEGVFPFTTASARSDLNLAFFYAPRPCACSVFRGWLRLFFSFLKLRLHHHQLGSTGRKSSFAKRRRNWQLQATVSKAIGPFCCNLQQACLKVSPFAE